MPSLAQDQQRCSATGISASITAVLLPRDNEVAARDQLGPFDSSARRQSKARSFASAGHSRGTRRNRPHMSINPLPAAVLPIDGDQRTQPAIAGLIQMREQISSCPR